MTVAKKKVKRVSPKEAEAKRSADGPNPEYIQYLSSHLHVPKGQKIDIRYLWAANYRANYWGKKDGFRGRCIVKSQFIQVIGKGTDITHKVLG
jgi:hypothetical protein